MKVISFVVHTASDHIANKAVTPSWTSLNMTRVPVWWGSRSKLNKFEHILGIYGWVQGCMIGLYIGRRAQDQAVPHDLSLTNKITGSGYTESCWKPDNRQTQLKILPSHNYVSCGRTIATSGKSWLGYWSNRDIKKPRDSANNDNGN